MDFWWRRPEPGFLFSAKGYCSSSEWVSQRGHLPAPANPSSYIGQVCGREGSSVTWVFAAFPDVTLSHLTLLGMNFIICDIEIASISQDLL